MASLSELLNPTPSSDAMPPSEEKDDVSQTYAPELFTQRADAGESKTQAQQVEDETQLETADGRASISSDTVLDEVIPSVPSATASMKAPSEKPRKSTDAGSKKDSKHSSKNEGQHTDRRYMCYMCDKLFTRRRSVRDHISKIHNTKTWEPLRSLEIIVEPISGEPMPPLEEQVAAGGAQNLPFVAPTASAPMDVVLKTEPVHDSPPRLASPQPGTLSLPSETVQDSVEPPAPLPIIGKKRPFSAAKKGTAKKVATPNKRAKFSESAHSTPFRSPSVASVQRAPTSKLSKTATESPASSRASSEEPSAASSPEPATPESTNDDGEVFCICRKGDNHTWMIACDGGCEEWFHGNCVNIKERDGELIDKYVCHRCQQEGFHTTWKRRCRRKGCRKPARVLNDPPSKYCSRDCGRMFFVDLIRRGDVGVQTTRNHQYIVEMERPRKKRKRRAVHASGKQRRVLGDATPLLDSSRPHTPTYSEEEKSEYDTDSSVDDDLLPNRGGALRASEVKALSDKCHTIDAWRALGRKPATPPREPDEMETDVKPPELNGSRAEPQYDEFEKVKLASIMKERTTWTERATQLSYREKLLEAVKARSAEIAEEVRKTNPKQKDICGYDARLAWNTEEFNHWLQEQDGQAKVERDDIGPYEPLEVEKSALVNLTNGHAEHGDDEGDEQSLPLRDGVCVKNRCQRHGSNRWQKAQLAELRFEQDLVRRALDKLDLQEQSIRERGILREWESRGA